MMPVVDPLFGDRDAVPESGETTCSAAILASAAVPGIPLGILKTSLDEASSMATNVGSVVTESCRGGISHYLISKASSAGVSLSSSAANSIKGTLMPPHVLCPQMPSSPLSVAVVSCRAIAAVNL